MRIASAKARCIAQYFQWDGYDFWNKYQMSGAFAANDSQQLEIAIRLVYTALQAPNIPDV